MPPPTHAHRCVPIDRMGRDHHGHSWTQINTNKVYIPQPDMETQAGRQIDTGRTVDTDTKVDTWVGMAKTHGHTWTQI